MSKSPLTTLAAATWLQFRGENRAEEVRRQTKIQGADPRSQKNVLDKEVCRA